MNIKDFLKQFKNIKHFDTEEEKNTGLLDYDSISSDDAFVFVMGEEEPQYFHTIGMTYTISISFFDADGNHVKTITKCPPGMPIIDSERACLYAVEYLPREDT